MSESFIKTEKIAIDHLLVEITRKCQLRCAHCLRGDAQNINLSPKIIYVFLTIFLYLLKCPQSLIL